MKKIFILFVYLFFLGSACFAGNSLPIYPGSTEDNEYNMFAAMSGFSNQFEEFKSYSVNNRSPKEIIKWYKSKLSNYSIVNEENANIPGMDISSLILKKGKKLIGITAIKQGENTIYFLGETVALEESGNILPTSDITHEKEPLPRYPESIMLSYNIQKDEEEPFLKIYDIEYGTKDSYEKVAKWYKRSLESNGWRLISQSYDRDIINFKFKKEDDTVTITIYAPNESNAYTEIDVYYKMAIFPRHDLVNGKDFLKRYPDSKLVSYKKSTFSMNGVNLINIKAIYLAPSTLENVKKWYAKMLKPNFAYVYENSYSIEAGKKDGTMLKIAFKKYVNFTEVSLDYTEIRK